MKKKKEEADEKEAKKKKTFRRLKTNKFTSLAECKKWVEKTKVFGCICPCCTQVVKVYKRKLNKGMAYELIALHNLVKHAPKDHDLYFHHTKFAKVTGGEISKLIHWEMVETKPKDEEDSKKKTSGYWTITEKGKKFVENKITVLSHIFISRNKLIGFSSEKISIKESLGKDFDYDELISNIIEIY